MYNFLEIMKSPWNLGILPLAVIIEMRDNQVNDNDTLILASQSPRRKEILTELGISFHVVPSHYEEDNARHIPPEMLVRLQAEGKARDVYEKTGGTVLGADTVVVLDGEVLGKPKDEADAERMLRELSGRTHHVLTGVAVIKEGTMHSAVCTTAVHFRSISQDEIQRYIATGEPMDKAGAYAIQGIGQKFVEHMEGSYSNVVGLPKALTLELLERS